MIEDKEHDKLIEANEWLTDLDSVVAFIKLATVENPWESDGNTLKPGAINWSWARNSRCCKYINIRVDMRDGAFVLLDQDKQRISLKQLQWQYSSKEEEKSR